ncbi:MAG TPA: hypothetical protein VGW10_06145 [Solirubrobacteraceae bacterium]|nr:hypothetical protein [Solirubrobacteraceae bacterium]
MAELSRVLAAAGGVVKTGYGAGALFAPDAMSRALLAPDVRGEPAARMSLRGFGGYLLVVGAATLRSAARGRGLRPILALNLLGEATDTAAGLLEWRARARADEMVLGSLGLSALGAATWIAALRAA